MGAGAGAKGDVEESKVACAGDTVGLVSRFFCDCVSFIFCSHVFRWDGNLTIFGLALIK